jgi:acyl-[acyl carrier protein]--UDP-N-acetylglucosamine O-acyltransferase
MATRKKKATVAKAEVIKVEEPTKIYPVVTVGSHLTVIEYKDGRTTLEWDDEALLRDVREAIASVQPKKGRKNASIPV